MANETQLTITGMKCAGCVASVEKALQGVAGVESAAVNFADHTALVNGQVEIEILKKAVADAGYAAEVASVDSSQQEDDSDVKKN